MRHSLAWGGWSCARQAWVLRLCMVLLLRPGTMSDLAVWACAQDSVCRCLMDIAAGMDYLHSLGVLHGERLLHAVP